MPGARQVALVRRASEADRLGPDNRLRLPLPELLDGVGPSWLDLVRDWRASPKGQSLVRHIEARRMAGASIYPADPLRALALTPRDELRVVIVGQDPYHGPGQAEGLAFSVPAGLPAPPSLRNIFAEAARDLGLKPRSDTSLVGWARQGVLLVNTALTVEQGRPGSHTGLGWEALTDGLVAAAARSERPIVFMLWGAHAAAKRSLIEPVAGARHCILLANHPSPLSARRGATPFLGCGHFAKADAFMAERDRQRPRLDWER